MTARATRADRHEASFRDPSGFIFRRDGIVYRQIQPAYREHYTHLMQGGLYDTLIEEGILLPHENVELDLAHTDDAFAVIRPEQLAFVSYPYEWCFDQLQDAALLTLRAQKLALRHGMTLKDASAYNVQMHGGRPVLIDTLSFEVYREGEPWVAYRQFCQHFLAPLALMSRKDQRLNQLLRIYVDGVPLDLAASLLPPSSRLNFALMMHIHAHAGSQRRHAQAPAVAPRPAASGASGASGVSSASRPGRFSRRAFDGLIDHLESAITRLRPPRAATEWQDYYEANNNYGDEGLRRKADALRGMLEALRPRTVWDLGANAGVFSRVAVEAGAGTVVSWDIDPNCVAANYRKVRAEKDAAVQPLLLDLTNPSPGVGWANRERESFDRRGPADVVLALGLIHHMAIANNVPLDHVASYLGDLCRHLVIEWVPKADGQVERLLATRRDVFADYDRESFERAFSARFRIDSTVPIEGTQRVLYRMEAA